MLVRKFKDCQEFVAGDKTILREFLHPDKQEIKIRYSLAHATLKPKEKSTPHKLKNPEVYFIIQGLGRMHIDDESECVASDDVVYIPQNSKQYIENIGTDNLKFLCIVDPAWKKEDEEIIR